MATYPTTPTTLTLASAFAGSILRDYRDSGFVQGTAIVRDVNPVKRSADVYRVIRKIDFATVRSLSVAGVQTAISPTGLDVLQVLPVGPGEVITGGAIRIIRPTTTVATCTVKLGATAISAAGIDLAAAAGTTTVIATALPLVATAADTVDILLGGAGTTIDGAIEIELIIIPAR